MHLVCDRSKNTVNILIKNWLDVCIGALVYWAVGFALTFGDASPTFSRFIGTSYFFFYDMPGKKWCVVTFDFSCVFGNLALPKWVVIINRYKKEKKVTKYVTLAKNREIKVYRVRTTVGLIIPDQSERTEKKSNELLELLWVAQSFLNFFKSKFIKKKKFSSEP